MRDLARTSFEAAGLRVEVNRPFAGALVPSQYYQSAAQVLAVMVEVNRLLYMDEGSGRKLPHFSQAASLIQEALRVIVRGARRAAA